MNSVSHAPPAADGWPSSQARSHRSRYAELHLRHQERHRHPRRERRRRNPLQRIVHRLDVP